MCIHLWDQMNKAHGADTSQAIPQRGKGCALREEHQQTIETLEQVWVPLRL